MSTVHGPPPRQLPITVRPLQHETLPSFASRLARANFTTAEAFDRGMGKRSADHLVGLAAAAGIPAERVTVATTPPPVPVDSLITQLMCLACARGAHVVVSASLGDNVCLRHHRWVGYGAASPADQFDTRSLPEVEQAQRRFDRWSRRTDPAWWWSGYLGAWDVVLAWLPRMYHFTDRVRERATRAHLITGFSVNRHVVSLVFPEIVTVATVLASPYWVGQAHAGTPESLAKFDEEMGRRLGIPQFQRAGWRDPLNKWLDLRRMSIATKRP